VITNNKPVQLTVVDQRTSLPGEPLYVYPGDVVRVAPSGLVGCTNVFIRGEEPGFGLSILKQPLTMYVVQGESSEVGEKLFGEPEDRDLVTEVENLKVQLKNAGDRYAVEKSKSKALAEEVAHVEARLNISHQRNTEYVDENRQLKDNLWHKRWLEKCDEVNKATAEVKRLNTDLDKLKCQFQVAGDRDSSAYWKEKYDALLGQSKQVAEEVKSLKDTEWYIRAHVAEGRLKQIKEEYTKLHEVLFGLKTGTYTS
jgi:hypothetical protein